jgi:hypothetical protein
MVFRSFFLVLFLSSVVFAAEQAGRDFVLLNTGLGARVTGMGTAFTAVANDSHAALYNPAGLVLGPKVEVGTMQAKLASDMDVFYLTAKYKVASGNAAWGGYWVNGSISDIPLVERDDEEQAEADEDIEAEDIFSYQAHSVGVSYATWLSPNTAGGLTISGFYKNFSKVSGGQGLGASITPGMMMFLDYDVVVGVVLRDIVNEQRWDTGTTETVLPELRTGVSWDPTGYVLLSTELRQKLDSRYHTTFHGGVEVSILKFLKVRAGVDEDRFTAGAGLYTQGFSLNYAYVGDVVEGIGDSHRVGITVGL